MSDFTERACAAGLARLPGLGPAGLVTILGDYLPSEAWSKVLRGEIRRPEGTRGSRGMPSWEASASRIDVARWWSPVEARGVGVTWFGRDDFPCALRTDPHPPGVLFWRGSLDVLSAPLVALVGTRSATPDGRATAFEMGRDLAAAGVCVASGLALGIDGAAHRGAIDAGGMTVGVAASGVDVPYPRQHGALWESVVAAGAVVSETPPGHPAQAWRFPSRNRIIAGLSQMVVVVESHASGGSLITAEAALERGVDVRIVPGPVHSPASEGSNQLLCDGGGPVRGASDVLDALGMIRPRRDPVAAGDEAELGSLERAVLACLAWRPTSLNQVVERSGLGVGAVAGALEALESRGFVGNEKGWWSRCGAKARASG